MNWKEEWKTFLNALFDPWMILLAILTIGLAFAQERATDPSVKTALLVLIGLFSGVIGSRYEKRASEAAGEKLLVARGRTAVRGLIVLVGQIQALEKRVQEYLTRSTSEEYEGEINSEVVKTYLEEVIFACVGLEEETLSSVEDWQDIIPEADIHTQIGVITELKAEAASSHQELESLRKKQAKDEERSESEVERLRTEIEDKKREFAELRRQALRVDPLSVGRSAISSGSPAFSVGDNYALMFPEDPGILHVTPAGLHSINVPSAVNTCPACGTVFSGYSCPNCNRPAPD